MDFDKALNTGIDNLTVADQVAAHVYLKAVIEASEARLALLKANLSIQAEAKGTVNENGTRALSIDGSKVTVEHRTASLPECAGLVALLKAKGMDPSEAVDTVTMLSVNAAKLGALIQANKVSEAEINALRAKTTGFRVYASKALKALVAPFKSIAGKVLDTGSTTA
jgi:hypothetical protein